jgi:transposase-like protein
LIAVTDSLTGLSEALAAVYPATTLQTGIVHLIWLALRNITATWGKEANFWRTARNQFAIVYGERFTAPAPPTP